MGCPVCTASYLPDLPDDVSVVEKQVRRIILQGKIAGIFPYAISPFGDFFTVSLYPHKGRVKYLKFRTQDELDKWRLIPGKRIKREGCLHVADGKETVFDITKVEFL